EAPGLVAAVGVGLGERPVAVPRTRHARLASGVRELDGWYRALAFDKGRNPSETFDMRIVPDARVPMRDAAALLHRGRLDEHHAGAALRELAEVHQVPVRDVAVLRRVLAHRRDDNTVPDPHVADRDFVEEHLAVLGFAVE